jgi:hypothetical protein
MLLGPKCQIQSSTLRTNENKWYLKFARFLKGSIVDQHIGVLVPKTTNTQYFSTNVPNQQQCKNMQTNKQN